MTIELTEQEISELIIAVNAAIVTTENKIMYYDYKLDGLESGKVRDFVQKNWEEQIQKLTLLRKMYEEFRKKSEGSGVCEGRI